MNEGDFSTHPPTIGELRCDRSGNANDWTPRDALIKALRDLDSGDWKPNKLCIIGARVDEFSTIIDTILSNCTTLELYGLMELAKLDRYAATS